MQGKRIINVYMCTLMFENAQLTFKKRREGSTENKCQEMEVREI